MNCCALGLYHQLSCVRSWVWLFPGLARSVVCCTAHRPATATASYTSSALSYAPLLQEYCTAQVQECVSHLWLQHCSPQMLRQVVPSRLCPGQYQAWVLRCCRTQPLTWQGCRQHWDPGGPAAPWWVCCQALQVGGTAQAAASRQFTLKGCTELAGCWGLNCAAV